MKIRNVRFIICFACLLVLSSCVAYAQTIERLLLNETQNVILSFSSEIKYVDFGIGSIKGERLSSPKMLSLQSRNPEFSESTISVVTSDGGYHQFSVSYAKRLDKLVWQESGHSFETDSIGFSNVKTTHFICDERISDIVVSSESVIAEYAEKIENIVKAKALEMDFTEASMHLITQSGYIYTFIVKPEVSPQRLSVVLSSEAEVTQSSQAIFKSNSVNDDQMRKFAEKLTKEKPSMNDIGVIDLKMAFAMSGIYSFNDLIAFKIDVVNMGKIDYVIDFIKGYIKDKPNSKTMAVQEEELTPVYTYFSKKTDSQVLTAGESETIVLFFTRFTIPHKRILYFEMFERNGGRHLSFPVSSKEILKAKAIY